MFLKVLNFRCIMSTMFSAQVALVVVSLSSFHIFCVESRLHSDSSNNNHNSFRHRMNSLSSKLISSMGIDRMPNYKNANISNEEYDRMYRVYQKSVEQTDLLRELREALENEDSDLEHSETKKLLLAPSGQNRVKRSNVVSDYWYSESGSSEARLNWDETSLFLTFRSEELEKEENKDAMLVVNSAKLHIKLVQSFSEESDASSVDETIVTMTLIQLTEENGYETGITIERIHLKANEIGNEKMMEFDVAMTVQAWLLKPEDNYGFQLICNKCDEAGITFDDIGGKTRLDVNGHDSHIGAGWRRVSHRRRATAGSTSQQSPLIDAMQTSLLLHQNQRHGAGKTDCKAKKIGGKRSRCCRHKMQVDLRDIPGFEFIQQPTTFDAHICIGRCPPRFNPANDHSLLQSLMHLKTQHLDKSERIPRPCCAPNKMEPLDILHIDENDPTRLRVTHWKNVIVGECSCS